MEEGEEEDVRSLASDGFPSLEKTSSVKKKIAKAFRGTSHRLRRRSYETGSLSGQLMSEIFHHQGRFIFYCLSLQTCISLSSHICPAFPRTLPLSQKGLLHSSSQCHCLSPHSMALGEFPYIIRGNYSVVLPYGSICPSSSLELVSPRAPSRLWASYLPVPSSRGSLGR